METCMPSTITTANVQRHGKVTRRLGAAVFILIITATTAMFFTLFNISTQLDITDQSRTNFYSQRAIESKAETSKNYLKSYAHWTAAFQHLHESVDINWAYTEQNVGKTLYTNDGYEAVFILDRNQTKYALIKGSLVSSDIAKYVSTPANEILRFTQTEAALANPISIYTLFQGVPAILTASPITPNDVQDLPNPTQTSVLIFVDQLTPSKLSKLGKSYGLDNLSLSSEENLPDRYQMPLGDTGHFLTAHLARPGHYLLHSLLPTLILTISALLTITAYLFYLAWRSSKLIDTNFETTIRSNQALALANRALAASEDRFRDVAEAASDWIWEVDDVLSITYLSGRFTEVTGFSANTWIGRQLDDLLECDTTPLSLWLEVTHEGGKSNELRCTYRDASGRVRFCRVSARPVTTDRKVSGYRGTASDITDEVAANARIQHLSLHDALTGLPNRNKLARYWKELIAREGQRTRFSLLMLDLDNFKPINDSLGHLAGDAVLQEISSRLRECTRDQDLVVRLGGDEFALIIVAMANREEADKLCTRLVGRLHEPIPFENQSLHIGASIGIAFNPDHGSDLDEIIRCADIALYQAKLRGKNTWSYFEEHMNEQVQTRRRLETDLRQAIANNEFVLHFQPRYHVQSRQAVAVEALVRWNHPTRGFIGPDLFIPLAEQSKLIVPLGRWVLQEACNAALNWPSHIMLSVNLSPIQFIHSDIVDDVRIAIVTSGLSATRLELEVTENVMLSDSDDVLATMIALKQLGVRLNMDDFGTGYSSLGYLRTYPFDGIKIDKRFISTIASEQSDRAVVQAIISLGKALGLTVTAEGVETDEQLSILSSDDCEEVQGYLLSRPIDHERIVRLLNVQETGEPIDTSDAY